MWRQDDDVQRMLRESIDAYVAAEHNFARVRKCRASDHGFDRGAWKAMAELGWAGILLDEEQGGAGLGLGPALPLAETFGKQLVPEPFVTTAVIAATVLSRCAGPRGKEIATALAAGDRIVSLAYQETLNQVATGSLQTKLEEKDGRLALSGAKIFVPTWSDATDLLVSCTASGETAIVHVAPGAPGLLAKPRKMSDGTLTAEIRFDHVIVDDGDIILRGNSAGEALDLAVSRGLIALCAQLEGLAAAAFRTTVDYMNSRIQFGQPLAEFQALRHRMVDLHSEIELSGASWRRATALLEQEGAEAAGVSISAAKARCSQTGLEVCKTALQYHGAFGYTEDADIGLFLNAALRLSSWMGNAAVHRRRAYELHRQLVHA